MSSKKKGLVRTIFTANGTCGGCGKTKASEVHDPTPVIAKNSNIHHQNKSHTTKNSFTTSTTSSSTTSGEHKDKDFTSEDMIKKNNLVFKQSPLMDSVAVEKESSDPYHDFRHSMLQMIFEKEIDSEEDLHDLLECFLHLNAPSYHNVILKAFNEICEEAFPDKVSSTTHAEPSSSPQNRINGSKSQ